MDDVPNLNVSQTARRLRVKMPSGTLQERRAKLWRLCQDQNVQPVGNPLSNDPRLDVSMWEWEPKS